jgi:hypothetical protein
MEKGDRRNGGLEQAGNRRESQRAARPAPGKVTRTSNLSPGHAAAVQCKAAAPNPGAEAPQGGSLRNPAMDQWMDAAHRGATALSAERQDAAVVAGPTAANAAPIQMQAPASQPSTGIEERFASHAITAADLANTYVVQQFQQMDIRALFEYRRQASDEAVRAHILTLIDGRQRDPYQSYLGKTFTISSNSAVIRDRDGNAQVYAQGDVIPQGKAVGQQKVIPNGTSVYITDIRDDLKYVHAEDWGWTAIGNISGGMYNETIGIDRAEHESTDPSHKTVATHDCAIRSGTAQTTYPRVTPQAVIPQGTNVEVLQRVQADGGNAQVRLPNGSTVWTRSANLAGTANQDGTFKVNDAAAAIRRPEVTYPVASGTVAQGERVAIVAQSQDTDPAGKYVQVAYTKKNQAGEYVRDEDKQPVWVEASHLADGWADFKSDNARWRKSDSDSTHGVYLGQMDVVRVIGRNAETDSQEVEKVSSTMLARYQDLLAAAAGAGHSIKLNSGFRSFPEQQELWDANPNPAEVARPGRSNHQNGIAIDINTGSFTSALYLWMKTNGPTYGFIRTVSGEHWHWEYRPTDAATHGYKLPSVSP